jgi:hypothetical protein
MSGVYIKMQCWVRTTTNKQTAGAHMYDCKDMREDSKARLIEKTTLTI